MTSNPSLYPTFASRLRRLSPAGQLKRWASEESVVAASFYYIYGLKDPRTSPARPFHSGKGTGSRAYHHLVPNAALLPPAT